ncbi:queuosine 5'-phosphate N-glycosylase/hydrolase-like [Glandiceps talaboti]
MTQVLSPRESAKFIADTSLDVKVNLDGVHQTTSIIWESLKNKTFSLENWKKHELHPKEMNDATVDWIFLIDTLNFSFWADTDEEKFKVKYKGKEFTGYWSLCAAVNRALDDGIPVTSPAYYATITMDQVKHIFRSDSPNEIPLLEERYNNLREVGTVLNEKYNGSFVNCIRQCDQSAQKLLDFIVSTFPCYLDVATHQGKQVSFYKRAQILVADLWSCFLGQGHGTFHDIDCITMFADYRVPQALVYYNALQYSDSLLVKLNESTRLTPGERHEVEIRGCSIWAVELIYEEMKKRVLSDSSMKDAIFNSIIIDQYLWDDTREHRKEMSHIPIHKIRTIFY